MTRDFQRNPAPPEVMVVEVVRVTLPQGEGVKGDPVRLVTYYFDQGGSLLAVHDPSAELEND